MRQHKKTGRISMPRLTLPDGCAVLRLRLGLQTENPLAHSRLAGCPPFPVSFLHD